MSEPISDPGYWKTRLMKAQDAGELHRSIFVCPVSRWQKIEEAQRRSLQKLLLPNDRILDAGCGYGRLLTLLPASWQGVYLGLDLSPDFVDLAKATHPGYSFCVGSLLDLSTLREQDWDWAICVSMRPMIRRNLGGEVWDEMEQNLRQVAKRLLFLEYDETDAGEEVIEC